VKSVTFFRSVEKENALAIIDLNQHFGRLQGHKGNYAAFFTIATSATPTKAGIN